MNSTSVAEESPPLTESPSVIEEISPSFSNFKKPPVDWIPATYIVGMHLAALAGFFFFTWKALAVCIVLHWITGGVGITLTYHRLLTHRSFRVPKWLEYFLSVIGCLASQGGPLTWVSTHRLHHAKSDTPLDPHSPRQGFFWAHMEWCMRRVLTVDSPEGKTRLAPDLAKDPVHQWLDKYHILWTFPLALALYLWGGLPFVIWGVCVRLVLVYHSTWLVNSAAHVWGYKTYDSKDDSTNLWWVALLTYGEGWHNNHHAFQSSARHGLQWWEFDTTYWMIQFLKILGLASDIKVPSAHLLSSKAPASAA